MAEQSFQMSTTNMNKDPLHIHPDVYTVFWNDKPVYTLNKALIDQQNAWLNIDKIVEAHELKLAIYFLIDGTNNKKLLRSLALDLREIEFELQALWGFSLDAMFHRQWEYPKCKCPRLDNIDAYPHNRYISSNCPLHSEDL